MISIIFYLLIFMLGLIVGSFLNCVIYRLETKQSFLKGRSFCPHCKHKLFLLDLVPVFSFILVKGKCRYCQKKISIQYPLVEIVTGILFLIIFQLSQSAPPAAAGGAAINITFLFVITAFLIIIFVYDLKHFIIPDKVIFPAIVIAFLYRLIRLWNLEFTIWKLLLAAIVSSAFFLIIFLVSRGKWIGFGDVKLGFFIGLLLGWPNIIPGLFISFLLGAIIGIGLILAKKKRLKSEVPFGPFLVTGTFIALFWGEKLINRYLNLFI